MKLRILIELIFSLCAFLIHHYPIDPELKINSRYQNVSTSISNELYDDMHHPSTSHQAPSASSSSSDLLSSILKSQAILFMDSDNVKIDENGLFLLYSA